MCVLVSLSLSIHVCLCRSVFISLHYLLHEGKGNCKQINECHQLGKRVIVFLSQIHANNRRWLKERGKKEIRARVDNRFSSKGQSGIYNLRGLYEVINFEMYPV